VVNSDAGDYELAQDGALSGSRQLSIPIKSNSKSKRPLAIMSSDIHLKEEEQRQRKLWKLERERRHERMMIESEKRKSQQEMEE